MPLLQTLRSMTSRQIMEQHADILVMEIIRNIVEEEEVTF